MTFLQLQNGVRAWVTARSDITTQMIKDAINNEYLELIAPFRFDTMKASESPSSSAGNSELTLTNTYLYISHVKEEKYNTPLIMVEDTWVDENGYDETEEGYPEVYWSSAGTNVRVWPVPDAVYQFTVRGYKLPAVLVNDADIPLIPSDWHRVIELGAASELCMKFNMMERGQMLMNKKLGLIGTRQESITMRNRLRHGQARPERTRRDTIRWRRGED